MKKNISNKCLTCQHHKLAKCWTAKDSVCVKYLPIENTNLIEIEGAIEVPPELDSDIVCQKFINWVESQGWFFSGSFSPYSEEDK